MTDYTIRNIRNYSQDGRHQEVVWDIPFVIRKGEDPYYYTVKGVEFKYNDGEQTTKKWICRLHANAQSSLENEFEIKTSLDVDKLVKYCVKLYHADIMRQARAIEEKYPELKCKTKKK